MIFIALLILITLSIAGSAAFFSIYGLAQIFSGSFLPVVIMAGSLEAGKLIAASYVYRFWHRISLWLKVYLISAILVLMAITSAGIFGFLSAAYQKDVLPLEEIKTRISSLDQQINDVSKLRQEDQLQLKQLEENKTKEIAALPANYATKKAQVAARYEKRITNLENKISSYALQIQTLTEEKHKLKLSTLQQELKTGPIVFIASAFGKQVDDATKWLILIIIFAFDPLAVALTVGANIAIAERQNARTNEDAAKERSPKTHEQDSNDNLDNIEIGEHMSSQQIQNILNVLQERKEPSPEDILQKQLLEEMLRRKAVIKKVRNPAES